MTEFNGSLEEDWVEYLEGELSLDKTNKVACDLEKHPDLKDEFLKIYRTRRSIKKADRLMIPTNDKYFGGLKNKIMSRIEYIDIDRSTTKSSKKQKTETTSPSL